MSTKAKTKKKNSNKTSTDLPENTDLSRVFKEEGVRASIARNVVAKIAGLAIREVSGVHALVPFGTGQALENAARNFTGKDMRDLGVHVEVGEVEAAVDVRIVTLYGESIPEIAKAMHKSVSDRVKEMTGLTVKELNIEVTDLYFPSEDESGNEDEAQRVR